MVSKVNTVAQIALRGRGAGRCGARASRSDLLVDYGSIPVALLTALSGAAYLDVLAPPHGGAAE